MIRSRMISKERAVRVTAGETERGDKHNKSLIPGTRILFKAIESFA